MIEKQKKLVDVDNNIYNDFHSLCGKMKIKIGDRLDKIMAEDIKNYKK